jgi:hypothetical protein
MQPLPGYQDLFPILPSFQHAPRLQIRAAFISPIAETPDIHTPSIRQHVMRSQKQAPFVLYTLSSYPFAGHSICDLSRYWWDLSKQPIGIACPPPKERILLRITVSKHSRTCMMALLFGALGRHETSCFFAPWKTDRARPLGLAGVVYGQHSYVPCYIILIREIKRLLVGFPGAVQKKGRNKRSYFRT